jgi:5-methylcytosine-specific restriction endonuclease McrA
MRICKKCGASFEKRCKPCAVIAAREWYHRLKENDIEKYREYMARRRKKSAESRKRGWRRWYHADPSRAYERVKKWREKNHERRLEHASRSAAVRTARKRSNGGSISTQQWEEIKAKQDGKCFDCGLVRKLQLGHLVPISRGGSSDVSNIVGQCGTCNRKQGSTMHASILQQGS